jgi:MoaA/NifB/PqqE/SkfB family radical SAM enzyme
MTLIEETRPKTKIEWILGNQCNYSCTYCHEMFRKGDRPFPSEELIAEVCKDIVYHFDDLGRDVVFEFIGGEPTLGGDVKEIGKRLHNHPINIVLRTNGSADLNWWKDAKKYLSHVIISVHKEFCNLNHIDEVVSFLLEDEKSHPINVKILIPTTHHLHHWQWALQTHNHYRSRFNLGNLQMLFSNFARGSDTYYPYSEDQWRQYAKLSGLPIPRSLEEKKEPILEEKNQISVIKDSPIHIDLKIRDPLNFNGYNCYAGIDTLVIDHNGRIWRGWCSQGGPIGSIYELPIQFPTEPIICGTLHCGNGFDQQARKES